jgi:hypothetical protein
VTDDPRVGGMTVNERLAHFGLFAAFEAAMKARDKAAVVAVLLQAELTPEQADYTATTVLRSPARYGY